MIFCAICSLSTPWPDERAAPRLCWTSWTGSPSPTSGSLPKERATRKSWPGQAAQTGEPVRIWACGGDGTLNEVVNGAAGFDNAAITCVPKGTGNDFLKVFGPNYRDLFYDLEALAAGPQTTLDLMDCNGKLGLDVVCGV